MKPPVYDTSSSFNTIAEAARSGPGLPFVKRNALLAWYGALVDEGALDPEASYYIPVQGPGEKLQDFVKLNDLLARIERVFLDAGIDLDGPPGAATPPAKPAPPVQKAAAKPVTPRPAPEGSVAARKTAKASAPEERKEPVDSAAAGADSTPSSIHPETIDTLVASQAEVLHRLHVMEERAVARHAWVAQALGVISQNSDQTLNMLEGMMEMDLGASNEQFGSPRREEERWKEAAPAPLSTSLLGAMSEAAGLGPATSAPELMSVVRHKPAARKAIVDMLVGSQWSEGLDIVRLKTDPTTSLLQIILAEVTSNRGSLAQG
jgi:hypothetical protein